MSGLYVRPYNCNILSVSRFRNVRHVGWHNIDEVCMFPWLTVLNTSR